MCFLILELGKTYSSQYLQHLLPHNENIKSRFQSGLCIYSLGAEESFSEKCHIKQSLQKNSRLFLISEVHNPLNQSVQGLLHT